MLLYIIKLSISFSIVYLFYQLFLRRLTFYTWNRWYLLIYSMVCFIIPLINVFTIIVERPALRESAFVNYIPAITQISPTVNAGTVTPASGINWLQVGVIVIVSGMLFMMVRLLLQYYSLYKMRSKAVLLYDENVKLYHINEPVMPFSFGRGIYVNQHQHSEDELKDIIRHEFIHVKQRHSIDILWSELLCILNWYNPFAWLLRHDIRQNLEFIADQQVLQTGLDRKQYQYLLLKVIGVNSFSIATNFNFSSLKRRIAMMNKTQSARVHLIRFLFLLPLLVVVLLAFRNTNQDRRQSQQEKQIKTDTVPVAAKETSAWKDVDNLHVIDNRKVTIRLKNGKVERYDMQITKEREAFESKYGSLPEPPPPPPIPAASVENEHPQLPEAPEKPELPEKPEAAEITERPEAPEAPEAPNPPNIIAHLDFGPGKLVALPKKAGAPNAYQDLARPTFDLQDCLNKKGYCITVADNAGEPIVIVKDKNSKIVEAIALSDWNNDKKKYEEKYGEMRPTLLKLAPIIKEGKPLKLAPITKDGNDKQVHVDKVNDVILERVPVKPQLTIIEKVAPVAKATPAVRVAADEVVMVEAKSNAKAVASAKAAAAAKVKAEELIVVRVKENPKPAVSAKPATEATPRVIIRAQKVEPTEEPKPAPGQPVQKP